MKRLKVFIRGMMEFRLSYTPHYSDLNLQYAYEYGRHYAHVLTFGIFEDWG